MYLDTSALVALVVNEPRSTALAAWYTRARGDLVSAVWCVTEFASALGINQHTGQRDQEQARSASQNFERLAANDLRLLALDPAHFHRAATLALDASLALPAGDALHLACAERAGATSISTLDEFMVRNALRLKIKPVPFD